MSPLCQLDFVEDKRERRRLFVQGNTEEGRVDVETLIAVFNEAEFPEFVHEKIHPRPRGPNWRSEPCKRRQSEPQFLKLAKRNGG
jgi:hypothetical protein